MEACSDVYITPEQLGFIRIKRFIKIVIENIKILYMLTIL